MVDSVWHLHMISVSAVHQKVSWFVNETCSELIPCCLGVGASELFQTTYACARCCCTCLRHWTLFKPPVSRYHVHLYNVAYVELVKVEIGCSMLIVACSCSICIFLLYHWVYLCILVNSQSRTGGKILIPFSLPFLIGLFSIHHIILFLALCGCQL